MLRYFLKTTGAVLGQRDVDGIDARSMLRNIGAGARDVLTTRLADVMLQDWQRSVLPALLSLLGGGIVGSAALLHVRGGSRSSLPFVWGVLLGSGVVPVAVLTFGLRRLGAKSEG